MAYELLVLDVDGTLVNTKKEITERTKEALWECQDQGIKVAIASGRCTEGIRHQAKAIGLDRFGGYVISFNGGRITNFASIHDRKHNNQCHHTQYDAKACQISNKSPKTISAFCPPISQGDV